MHLCLEYICSNSIMFLENLKTVEDWSMCLTFAIYLI